MGALHIYQVRLINHLVVSFYSFNDIYTIQYNKKLKDENNIMYVSQQRVNSSTTHTRLLGAHTVR